MAKQSVVASVVWWSSDLLAIVLVRRADKRIAMINVPPELRPDLERLDRLDRRAVMRNGMMLHDWVRWSLADSIYEVDGEVAESALANGATPAELGAIRYFEAAAVGVDIGEFDMPDRKQLH